MLKPETIQPALLRHRLTFGGRYCYVRTLPSRVLAAAAKPT
jgi:hypothetical protein